ncbi:hypothetical protein [uncultured Phenylobacterium sp.]|uniref:hypothetical protein n=1 Tax=uncultured Phenylobacterium sp. TaxID=349273 RepID=UPI0025D829C2|nr:hypothetical protein [uncultured Phenylobacterium sp.]
MAEFIGTSGSDTLIGGPDADTFTGGPGADVITGNDGNDTDNYAVGSDGADIADLGAGQDVVSVTGQGAGQVRLTFTSAEVGNGAVNDSGGLANQDGDLAVRFQSEDGAGVLTGDISRYDDEGIRFIAATPGLTFDVRDLVSGAARGDQFAAVFLGTQGADNITTSAVATYVNAGQEDDRVIAGAANDFLVGGGGADLLNGGAGADSLLGGVGADTLNGQEGDDTAIFNISTDGADLANGGEGSDLVNIAAAAGGQVRLTFTSAEVGNGSATDGAAGTNQDGGLAVRAQFEGTAGDPEGTLARFDDEGVTFVATTANLTFDVRDLISGAARGDQFRAVALGSSGADAFGATAEATYANMGAGNDSATGGQANDFLVGGIGADSLDGGLGADSFIGGSGNDTFAGGGGADQIIYTAARASYRFDLLPGGAIQVTDVRTGAPDGQDQFGGVEALRFSDGTFDTGRVFDNTLSVATLSYQFFTGKTPTEAGYEYLVNSPNNANDLNDPYYQAFSLENRFINFAVNLGVYGESRIGFESDYGARSLNQAATLAYREVFGFDAAVGKIDEILNTEVQDDLTRAEYFQAVTGSTSVDALAVKAAVVGFFLVEAVKADLGPYANANGDFLDDLIDDGSAQFNVNLLLAYPEAAAL